MRGVARCVYVICATPGGFPRSPKNARPYYSPTTHAHISLLPNTQQSGSKLGQLNQNHFGYNHIKVMILLITLKIIEQYGLYRANIWLEKMQQFLQQSRR
jgi:hypothetical protein